MALQLRRIKPSNSFLLANEARLANASAKYPFQNWRFFQVILPATQKHFLTPTLFGTKIPTKTLYCLMTLEQDRGAYARNSLVFQPYGLKRFTQLIDGLPAPLPTQEFDFANDDYAVAYRNLMDNLGILGQNRSNFVTYEAFKRNRFFLCYANSAAGVCASSVYREKESTGDLTVQLEFEDALTSNMVLQCYGIFDDYYEIDKDRMVTINSTRE